MSFCSRLIYFNPNKSLPKYRKEKKKKKAFLHISSKASYTLEMAVVLPLVAAFFVSILFFFRVLQVQTQVQAALNYASRKTAVQACVNDVPSPLLATAEVYFRKELKQYAEYQKYVAPYAPGASLLMSNMEGPEIMLCADYTIRLPIALFQIKDVRITQRSVSRKWTGDRETWTETDYVYVTEHGTVYHRSRSCRYLDLSIRTAEYAEIGDLRNKSEHKYYACGQCAAKNKHLRQVYITDYGEVYHTSLSCSGLKRTVYLIPISEVGGKGPCSKCG